MNNTNNIWENTAIKQNITNDNVTTLVAKVNEFFIDYGIQWNLETTKEYTPHNIDDSRLNNKTPIEYIESLKYSDDLNDINKEKRKIAYYELRENNDNHINIYFNLYNGDMEGKSPSLIDSVFRSPQKNIFIGTMYEKPSTLGSQERFTGTTNPLLEILSDEELTFILIKELGEVLGITPTDDFPLKVPTYTAGNIQTITTNANIINNNNENTKLKHRTRKSFNTSLIERTSSRNIRF